jgi:hypothetical protein
MKKTYLIHDIVWMGFAFLVCLGGLKLGFGSFHQPHAGFMPFLRLDLGLLALWTSSQSSTIGSMKKQIKKSNNIHWRKLFHSASFFIRFFQQAGFICTIPLLLFLYRLMEPRPWWTVIIASLITTGLFYLGFKVGLDSQLPRGFLGL